MFDFLTTKRGFRIAWVVALLASILAVVIDDIFPLNSNPDLKEKLTFAQDESFELLTGTKAIFFFAFFMLYVFAWIKSIVGVYRFKKKDLDLYIYLNLLALPLYYAWGDILPSYISQYMNTLAVLLSGLCIGAAYLSPLKSEFK